MFAQNGIDTWSTDSDMLCLVQVISTSFIVVEENSVIPLEIKIGLPYFYLQREI